MALLVRIGIDETSYKKGHKYITVVINHYDAILATMEHHLSNAVLEATNRKIKRSVYMACGFRNIDNMIDMTMLRCSDIDVRLPWDYEAD